MPPYINANGSHDNLGLGSSCDVDHDDHDYADAGKDDDNLLMITMTMLLLMMSSEPPHKPVRPSQKANSPCPRIPSACAEKLIFHGTIIMQKNKTLPRYSCPVHQMFKGLLSGLHKLWNVTFLICSASKVKY